MAVTKYSKRCANGKSGKGITLVEMIVVLVIMAILAASGIFTGVGYVKKTRFNQNEANAEIIYNAIQTALQQKEKSGTIDEWAQTLISSGYGTPLASTGSNKLEKADLDTDFDESSFTEFPKATSAPNESVHMRYVLTFSSGSSSNAGTLLKNLIQPYFYDRSIFKGTITAEFLAEKTLDSYKKVHYSAKCLSVFANSHVEGWGGKIVPVRAYSTRRNSSLVGYYEGYAGNTVESVYLPQAQLVLRRFETENVMVEVTPTPGAGTGSGEVTGSGSGTGSGEGSGSGEGTGEGTGSETEPVLEKHIWLSWTASLDKANITGTRNNYIYYKLELLSGNTVTKELILNESFMHKGDAVGVKNLSKDYTDLKDKQEGETTSSGDTVSVESYPVDFGDYSQTITIKSITVDAQIFIQPDEPFNYDDAEPDPIKGHLHDIKLKISYVSYEYIDDEKKKDPYYAYSFDITDLLKLNPGIDGARMTVYPNDFSKEGMKEIINTKAYLPFKSGIKVTIDQSEDSEE